MPLLDFGRVSSLEAEAIGEPGQRTFRLRVSSGQRSASLWLEKEQLQALALALMRLLVQMGQPEYIPAAGAVANPLSPFPEQPSLDLKVGRLGLGLDQVEGNIVLFAYEAEDEAEEESEQAEAEQAEAVLACRVAPAQCRNLVAMIEGIVAAGRPICRLCLGPIDPAGHVCARSNGHGSEEDLQALS
jgi:uncharacterized repeat protein (TIGR03847 family)